MGNSKNKSVAAASKKAAATPPKSTEKQPPVDKDGEVKKSDEIIAPVKPAVTKPQNSKVDILLEKYAVNEIYENQKGEFFINKNLALASENGKIDQVKTHKKL